MPDLTSRQTALLEKIAEAKQEESRALAKARFDAAKLIADAKVQPAQKTNELIAKAVYIEGINKSVVTRLGLGTTDRKQIYVRLEAVGIPEDADAEQAIEILEKQHPSIRVEQLGGFENGGVRVILDDFSHPDLGEGLTGSFEYDTEGDLILVGDTNAAAEEARKNPLFDLTLWGLSDVQDALR